MQQQQKQISTGGQGAQAVAQSGIQGAFNEGNKLALKNLAQGTTEESLTKSLRDLSINPSKVNLLTFDRDQVAQICFSDHQSLCNAAAIIDKSSTSGGQSFSRTNNKQKAQFNETTSVFVRNIPADVSDDDLFQEFQKAGSVINCTVLRTHNSASKCMGLVNFINQEQAQNAITMMHDKQWPNSDAQQPKLVVILYKEQDRMQRGPASMQQKTNLYVSGLPNGITEAQVRAMFQEFGEIRSILLKSPVKQNDMTKHITNLLPIYSMAYVNFETEEAALAAFALNNRDPMSQVKVAYYDKGQQNPVQFTPLDADIRGNTNYRILFLTKINKRVTAEELKEVCAKYGTVQSCKLSMGSNQMGQQVSLGKATVAYATTDEAATAMQKLYFESSLGDYIQIDFYKSRELRLEQGAQNSEFSRMLTQYSQRYQNTQHGYGRGQGGYQGRGGYNNQRGYRPGGGNQGGAAGAGRYQGQQQNSQYQPRMNRNNNQGGYNNGQQQRPGVASAQGQGNNPQGQQSQYRGGDRQSRGGGHRQHQNQYRNNQSQQYPNQRRQYQQNNRGQNNQGAQQARPQYQGVQQQRINIDQAAFPTLGGQPMPQAAPQAMPMPVPQQQQPQQPVITLEVLTAVGDEAAQKQYLGEHLYPRVAAVDGQLAGRIVGMILDAYTKEQIIENLGSEATLKVTIDRAMETIREHESAAQKPAGEV